MKTRTKHIAGALSASALFLGMLAASQTANAGAGIANGRHNLGINSGGAYGANSTLLNVTDGIAQSMTRIGGTGLGDVFTSGTDEICVFCHTPHGANSAVTAAPLWNKASITSTYTPYATGTMNGTSLSNATGGNMSLACLSCHDGTQAMDNMMNQPGQGGFNRTTYLSGDRLGTQTGRTGGYKTWYSGNNTLSVAATDDDVQNGQLHSNAGVDFLGTDLSNDHPIGMAYAGGGCTTLGATTGCADDAFNAPVSGLGAYFQVGSDTAGAKTAMRLYGTTLTSATVECGSCHDPHTDAYKTFLRKSNASSAVCLTCHNK